MFVYWCGKEVKNNFAIVRPDDEGVKKAALFLRIFNREFNGFMKAVAMLIKAL